MLKHAIASLSVATTEIITYFRNTSGEKPKGEIAYEQTTVMTLPKKITGVGMISRKHTIASVATSKIMENLV
jgi:hypothetical protein